MASVPLPDERDRAIKGSPMAADEPEIDGDDDLDLEMTEDGGAIVKDPSKKSDAVNDDFTENLAEVLEETELHTIAQDLLRRVEQDKLARQDRDKQYAEGLRRTGLSDDAPGGAQFAGASRAAHPVLAEASIDFNASAMRELLPSGGPVRTEIIGEQTQEKVALADRQKKFLNWYLTTKMVEYPDELAQTMTQLPMGGSQFMKFWGDVIEKRVMSEFVPVEDLLLPYGAASFYTASRITHVQRLPESEWDDRIESGMYRDVDEAPPGDTPEQSKAGEVSERIEGASDPGENIDGIRLVYEVNTYLKISVDKEERLPYLMSICERTGKVVSLYRNWEEDDAKRLRLQWIADFAFIPWRGAYKLGLPQLIGGLSAAATGALRALLDSALVNTIPTLAKLKGAKFGSQSKTLDATSMIEIDAGTTVDDIRKALMALPFNPPSPVLMTLLGWLTDAAKGVVTTAEEKIAEAKGDMPMGTALALIEQGAKVFSSIHAGLHRSQKKAFAIIARILKDPMFCDVNEQIEEFGEVLATPEDFAKPLGIVPVSDPNIFSEGQRYAQMQLVAGNAEKYPQLHNLYEVLRTSYKLAKIPDIDRLLPPPKEPTELNSAAENTAVMLGGPVQAFPEQNHMAHLEVHMRFIMDPLFGANPASIPKSYPAMMEHIKQHLALLYAKTMHDMASEALGSDIGEAMKDKKKWNDIEKLLAGVSRTVHNQLMQILAPLGPEISKMMQQIEKMRTPPPMDPSQAAIKVATMEDARSREDSQRKAQLDAQKLADTRSKDQSVIADRQRQTDIAAALAAAKIAHEGGQMLDARHSKVIDTELKRIADERAHALAVGDSTHVQDMDRRRMTLEAASHMHDRQMDMAGHQHALQQHDDSVTGQHLDREQQSVQHQDSQQREVEAGQRDQQQFESTQRAQAVAAKREAEDRERDRKAQEKAAKSGAGKDNGKDKK